ncbi:MAG: TolC family protein [Zhaonellaceae bacterium]
MSKKIVFLVGLLLLLTLIPAVAAPAEDETLSLTLEEAMELALANNNQVELNRLSIEKAKLELEQAKHGAKKIDFDAIDAMPREMRAGLGLDMYQLHLAKYVAPVASQAKLTIAEKQVELSENVLRLEVEKNYYELLRKKTALDNAQNALLRAQEQLRIAQESYKAGVLAKSDVVGAEVLVASKEAEVVNAQNQFDKAVMNLAQTLGLELDTKIVPATQFSFEPVIIDLAKEVEKALEQDISVIGAKEGLKVAEVTFEQARGFYTPNVFMYREAEYGLEEAKVNLKKAQDEVELKVRNAYLDLLSAQKAYETLEKSLEAAKENYRVAKLRFEAGVATRLEMEQAADQLSEQEGSLMEMLYNYNLAAALFKYGIFN